MERKKGEKSIQSIYLLADDDAAAAILVPLLNLRQEPSIS